MGLFGSILKSIPILGGIIEGFEQQGKLQQDRMKAMYESTQIHDEAEAQKLQYETLAQQAQLDYENTSTLYEETLLNRELSNQAWNQKIDQRNVEGQKTIGSQTALQAMMGQLGTGSAEAVSTETKTNLSKDLTQMGETRDLEDQVLGAKAEGYQTAMTLLLEQAETYQDAADKIDPDKAADAYLSAYMPVPSIF